MNQVLLVGEGTARLEVDLVPYGMACHGVVDASAAVVELKAAMAAQQPWSFVIVAETLPDMTGPAFIDGLMRHFDPGTVVLVANVDAATAQHLSSSPKIRIFPADVDGVLIADHLFKRMGGGSLELSSSSSPPPPSPQMSDDDAGMVDMSSMGGMGMGMGSLASLFDPPPTGSVPPPQQTPSQAYAMPPPGGGGGALWAQGQQAPAQTPAQPRPTTMPFFAALGANGVQAQPLSQPPTSQPPMSQPPMSQPPTSTGPDRATLARIEAMAEELENANAEIVTMRARLQATEKRANEATQKLYERDAELDVLKGDVREARTELDMVRAAAASDVAEISTIADDSAQLDSLQVELHAAQTDRDGAVGQLEMVRAERDQLATAVESLRQELGMVRVAGEQAQAELSALQALATEKDLVVEERSAELTVARERVIAAETERQQLLAELENAHTALGEAAGLKAELELTKAEKVESEGAWAQEQEHVKTLEAQLGEAEAAQHDLVHKVEVAEQKVAELEAVVAVMDDLKAQLEESERYAKLEEARADRAVSDAAGMRSFIEAQTHEQARVVGELEQLRPIATEVERARAGMADMQRQLEAALGTDDDDGSTEGAITEGVKARTRELMELARAIEPFTWGLDQAAAFFADVDKEGATRHVQAMRLLQKTLERLKNELDKVHQG